MRESTHSVTEAVRWLEESNEEKQRVCLLIECQPGGRRGDTGPDEILLDLQPVRSSERQKFCRLVGKATVYRLAHGQRSAGANAASNHGEITRDGRTSSRDLFSASTASGDANCGYYVIGGPENQDWACPERPLTPRQYEILMALKSGQSNKEIGRCMGILESTVKAQLKSIYRHLRVSNRTQAAIVAARCLDRPLNRLSGQGPSAGYPPGLSNPQ